MSTALALPPLYLVAVAVPLHWPQLFLALSLPALCFWAVPAAMSWLYWPCVPLHVGFRVALLFPALCMTCLGLIPLVYWWKERRAQERSFDKMEDPLHHELERGTIRLVRAAWLLRQPADYVCVRSQDLPDEAFVPSQQAVSYLKGRRVAVLSYGWAGANHPDPTGLTFRCVVAFLRRFDTQRVALFWDWVSLPQKQSHGGSRTEAEERRFKAALAVMLRLYASPRCLVIQQKRLPDDAENPRPYSATPTGPGRGWCFVEETVASWWTDQLGTHHIVDLAARRGEWWRGLPLLSLGCSLRRKRKRLRPGEMELELNNESKVLFTNGKADAQTVTNLYRGYVKEMDKVQSQKRLSLRRLLRAVAWLLASPIVLVMAIFSLLMCQTHVCEQKDERGCSPCCSCGSCGEDGHDSGCCNDCPSEECCNCCCFPCNWCYKCVRGVSECCC